MPCAITGCSSPSTTSDRASMPAPGAKHVPQTNTAVPPPTASSAGSGASSCVCRSVPALKARSSVPDAPGSRAGPGRLAPPVERQRPQIDPYANDPGRWAHSLQNLAEIVLPCLDAAGVRSVVEVGAYAGDLTSVLVDWAAGARARVIAVDPSPQESLVRLADERVELE